MSKNYHGSRVAKKNPAPKRFALLLALVLILVGTVGGTVAFLATHTGPVKNTFIPGKVTCQVEEKFNEGAKSEAVIRNTGNVPAYIRVAVVGNTMDGNNVTGKYDVSSYLDATEWFLGDDGFYYYKGVVQPGDTTSDLIKTDIPLPEGKQVTILASAIQSTPDEAVNSAWHMKYSSSGWEHIPSAN